MQDQYAIRQSNNLIYPAVTPYNPSMQYVELDDFVEVGSENNTVYDAVRQSFLDLQMDQKNIGTAQWSPFDDFIKTGNTVVIKPNLVRHHDNEDLQLCVTTHPSVLRPIIDYCWKALRHNGRIIVGDAPSTEAEFDKIITRYGLNDMIVCLQKKGINVQLMDFRSEKTIMENGIWVDEQQIEKAPESQIVNLGKESMFYGDLYKEKKLHGGGYGIKETTQHHQGERQEYCVSKVLLSADVVISVPKLKTHKKAGITCCMKNLVGINTNKNYLPHWIQGSYNIGGDEMPTLSKTKTCNLKIINFYKENIQEKHWRRLNKFILKTGWVIRSLKEGKPKGKDSQDMAGWLMKFFLGQPIYGGAWVGNETICRMIIDLNKIFLCCNQEGILCEKTNRKYFYVTDAIIMGMKNGPMTPSPLHTGIVASGFNGLQIDAALIRLLQIDPLKIPLYNMSFQQGEWLCGPPETQGLFNGSNNNRNSFSKQIELPSYWEL